MSHCVAHPQERGQRGEGLRPGPGWCRGFATKGGAARSYGCRGRRLPRRLRLTHSPTQQTLTENKLGPGPRA